MFSSVLTTRLLGAEGRGLWAICISITGIGVQFGNLGIHSANTYYISKNKRLVPFAIGNSLLVVSFASILAGVYFLLYQFFPHFTSIGNQLLLLALFFIPIQLAVMLQQNIFIATGHIKNFNFYELLSGICFPVVILAVSFFFPVFVGSMLGISLLIHVFILILMFITLKKYFITDRVRISNRFFKRCLAYGLKIYFSALFVNSISRVSIFVVNKYFNLAITGQYALAVSLAEYANLITSSVALIYFPELVGLQDRQGQYHFVVKVLLMTMAVLFLVILAGFFIAPLLIPLLYGKEFTPSIPVFRVMLFNTLVFAPSVLWSVYSASLQKHHVSVIVYAIGFIINIVLTILLIPHFGILGAAMSFTGTYLFTGILFGIFFVSQKKAMKKG